MASPIAPANSRLVTVTAELATYCNREIGVFTDTGDIAYIEIASYKDGTSSFRDCTRPADVTKWLASNSVEASPGKPPAIKTLKLLIVPLNYDELPYSPFPEGAFEAVATVHNLQKDYLSSEWLQSPSIAFGVPLDDRLSGFVMKARKWNDDITHFCLSSVFNASAMHSSCILRISTKEDLRDLKTRLEAVADFAWYPYFIAAILIEKRLERQPAQTNTMRHFLYRVEQTTGTHKNFEHKLWANGANVRTAEESWTDPDFEVAPAELTSIASDCIKRAFTCRSRARLLDFLEDEHGVNLEMGSIHHEEKASRMLVRKLRFMRAWIEESESRFAYIGKRAEVQTQMCNSLMGQRDNALNKRISETSLAVSRFSRQDSAYMRTIAVVGLAFLPATFMATLFSTDFFAFQGEGQLVSHWFWLYWAIVIPLTAAVYVGYYLSIYKQRRETRGFSDDMELASMSNSKIA